MERLYRRSADLLEAELGDEIVALDAQSGTCFGFNSVAASVWRLLEHPQSAQQIAAALQDEYDVEPETCREEIAVLLHDLVVTGLIAASEAA
jgi:hypothetical protein